MRLMCTQLCQQHTRQMPQQSKELSLLCDDTRQRMMAFPSTQQADAVSTCLVQRPLAEDCPPHSERS